GELRLGEASGGVSGILTAPSQPATEVAGVGEQLAYGRLLQNGSWKLETAPRPPDLGSLKADERIELELADVQGQGGWGVFQSSANGTPLTLGHFQDEEGESKVKWTFSPAGLDALDLTGAFAPEAGEEAVIPTALKAEPQGDGVWIGADIRLPQG